MPVKRGARAPEEADNSVQLDEDAALSAFAEAFTGDSRNRRVYVSRYDERNGWEQLFQSSAESPDEIFDEIRKDWGGGRLKARIMQDGVYAKQIQFAIAKPPNWRPPAPVIEPQPSAHGQGEFASVMQAMIAMQERSDQRFAALMERMTHPAQQASAIPSDPFALADRMMGLVTTMVATTKSAQGEGGIDLIMKGVELAQKLGGNEPAESGGFLDVIRDGVKMIPSLLEAQAAAAQRAPAVPQPGMRPSPPLPARRPLPQPAVQPANDQQMAVLLAGAARDTDPAVYAQLMVDTQPPEMIDVLLAQADPLAFLALMDERVKPYGDWFLDLVDILREMRSSPGTLPGNAETGGDVREHAAGGDGGEAANPGDDPG
jgi:hypothetical protein